MTRYVTKDTPIKDLEISFRAFLALSELGAERVGDLANVTETSFRKHAGPKVLKEVKEYLRDCKLTDAANAVRKGAVVTSSVDRTTIDGWIADLRSKIASSGPTSIAHSVVQLVEEPLANREDWDVITPQQTAYINTQVHQALREGGRLQDVRAVIKRDVERDVNSRKIVTGKH